MSNETIPYETPVRYLALIEISATVEVSPEEYTEAVENGKENDIEHLGSKPLWDSERTLAAWVDDEDGDMIPETLRVNKDWHDKIADMINTLAPNDGRPEAWSLAMIVRKSEQQIDSVDTNEFYKQLIDDMCQFIPDDSLGKDILDKVSMDDIKDYAQNNDMEILMSDGDIYPDRSGGGLYKQDCIAAIEEIVGRNGWDFLYNRIRHLTSMDASGQHKLSLPHT